MFTDCFYPHVLCITLVPCRSQGLAVQADKAIPSVSKGFIRLPFVFYIDSLTLIVAAYYREIPVVHYTWEEDTFP